MKRVHICSLHIRDPKPSTFGIEFDTQG